MSWRRHRLQSAAEVLLGRQRSPEHAYGEHPVAYLRAANVIPGRLELDDVKVMNFKPHEQRIFALRAHDVLVTEGSGSLGTVGAAAQWQADLEGLVCFQNTLLRLRARRSTHSRFLYWWTQHAFHSGLLASVAGGANIYHLSAERVRALPIELPPMGEQRRIADFLDAETKRLDALRAMRKRQRVLAQDRFERWSSEFMSSTVSSAQERSGPWPWLRLKHVASVHGGLTLGKTYESGREFAYLRVANVQDRHLDLSELLTISVPTEVAHRFLLRVGDLLMLEGNGNPANLGRGTLWRGEVESCLHQNHVHVVRRLDDRVLAEYLDWAVRSEAARWFLTGAGEAVSIATLSQERLGALPLPLPPLKQQQAMLRELDAAHESHRKADDLISWQASCLTERQQALITAAVTGQIDVTTARGVA